MRAWHVAAVAAPGTPRLEAALGADLTERLRAVRLLVLDVDGVLTDGHLYWSDSGAWSQRFSVRDGYGIKLLQQAGVEVAILSGGDIRSARARAESLHIRHAWFGVTDKVAAFDALARQLDLAPAQAAFIGDELIDIPLIRHVGFGATVPDAVDEVCEAACYVTRRPGGDGAVREVCDLIRRHAPVTIATAAATAASSVAGAGTVTTTGTGRAS